MLCTHLFLNLQPGNLEIKWKRPRLLRIYVPHAWKRFAVSRRILSTAPAFLKRCIYTSSEPARDQQCPGQAFLLLWLPKANVLLHTSLCSNGCGTHSRHAPLDQKNRDPKAHGCSVALTICSVEACTAAEQIAVTYPCTARIVIETITDAAFH